MLESKFVEDLQNKKFEGVNITENKRKEITKKITSVNPSKCSHTRTLTNRQSWTLL